MKVLYVLANSPQDCESYIEAEIKYAIAHGVQIEIWSSLAGYGQPPIVPVHYGTLESTVDRFRPDLVHVHYLVTAVSELSKIPGIRATVRAHSFDWDVDRARKVASFDSVQSVYAFPHFARELAHPKIVPLSVAYDHGLYVPLGWKERRLVLRLSSGRRVKGLRDFLEIGNRIPEADFILGITPLRGDEAYLDELRRENRRLGDRVDIRTGGIAGGLSRGDVFALTQRAGIYLQTSDPAGHRLGMQISLAEAMSTGAVVFARQAPTLPEYLGDAGVCYRSIDEAEALVRETFDWTDQRWADQSARAIQRSQLFRSDVVLPRLVEDWEEDLGQAMMTEEEELDALLAALAGLGAGGLVHTPGRHYAEHCAGVYTGLLSWGLSREIARAGFFHSIYGTERFQAFKLSETAREDVQIVIGRDAEALAYAHCAMRREDFDRIVLGDITEMVLPSRFLSGGAIRIADLESFRRLIALHLADWLDQVPFMDEWNYRRPVYRRIAEMLGDRAYGAYSWVYRGR